MKIIRFFYAFILLLGLASCIKEDVISDEVKPAIRFTNPLQSLALDDSYLLKATFTNTIGQEESKMFTWSSSNDSIVTIDMEGKVSGKKKGESIITVSTTLDTEIIEASTTVKVSDQTIEANEPKKGTIVSTSSYELQGDFTLKKIQDQEFLELSIANNYVASTALPGLYLYLTNNPNSINGALEIGPVTVFSGEHSYSISTQDATLNQYQFLLYWCKPFSV
ncbi:Ig-like domain-containing protein [Aquimarina intermedia]|uniref:Ig-like protein group 2 n=1 Tax=Aquimarina intermedia TaxID=350814 RepID=A0A5S5C9A6_9FLAO|nr:Ig-like domain-containing protein [Aquimarina intermedia]TYP75924.1 Ig-like protein group 2 [Aquimarina intermedia]